MNEIKEQQKKMNIEKANKTRLTNRKIHKFNNFNNEDNKRNKQERKLYSMLNSEQKKEFKIRVELLGLNMDFFKEIYLLGFGVSLFGISNDWKISNESMNKLTIEDIEKLILYPQIIHEMKDEINDKTNEEKINILIPPPPLSLKKPSNKKIISKK